MPAVPILPSIYPLIRAIPFSPLIPPKNLSVQPPCGPPEVNSPQDLRLFDEREAHARKLGRFTHTAFCAVERPADHYRPLDPFWKRRGYRKQPDLQARFPWRDLDDREETEKTLVFWIRELL